MVTRGWVEPVRGTSAEGLHWSRDDLVLATPALVLSGTVTTNFGAGCLLRSTLYFQGERVKQASITHQP